MGKTSTERSRERRERIYKNKLLHEKLKEKERDRKNFANRKAAEARLQPDNETERVLHRLKQREAKRKYREKKKNLNRLEEAAKEVSFSTPQKAIVKNKIRRLRRSYEKRIISTPAEIPSSSTVSHSETNSPIFSPELSSPPELSSSIPRSETNSPMLISSTLWKCLSPSQKKKVKSKLQHDGLPYGMNMKIRKELGLNLSINTSNTSDSTTLLQKIIKKFYLRDDVSRLCPDTKKMKKNPNNPDEAFPTRYRLSTISALFEKFKAENSQECSFSYFAQNCPFNVVKPNPNDWGTCLCIMCLNPEIKLEALSRITKRSDLIWNDTMDYTKIDELVQKIKSLNFDTNITFSEWQKIEKSEENGKLKQNKKNNKVSRKVLVTLSCAKFKTRLLNELKIMHDHKLRVHSQYKAFKLAREEAQTTPDVITLQLDWSENAKMRQSREEKSAYYYEDSVSLHPMYIWSEMSNYSRCALSDCTDHKAPAVMASIQPILDGFVSNGVKKINFISDSPSSQYRYRTMCWLLHSYCLTNKVEIKWIWLESGHGKGIPDGIGATVKKAISDILCYNPDKPVYTINDLMLCNLQVSIPSISLSLYTVNDVQIVKSSLPVIDEVKNIMKAHEIFFKFKNGELTTEIKDISMGKARKIKITSTKMNASLPIAVVDSSSYPKEVAMENDDSSSDEEYITYGSLSNVEAIQKSFDDDDNIGRYYCIYFDKDRYWGLLTKVFSYDDDSVVTNVEFKFLRYVADGRWKFPKTDDIAIVECKYVFYGPVQATSITKAGYHFGNDDIEALHLYKSFKTANH